MTPADYAKELTATAEAMLEGRLHLIEGCRVICGLCHGVEDPGNRLFHPIIAAESDTDHFVLGKVRDNCEAEYLRRKDAELEKYLANAREDILKCCREIIQTYGERSA